MYHAETNTPALARTSNLNEELGQVNGYGRLIFLESDSIIFLYNSKWINYYLQYGI